MVFFRNTKSESSIFPLLKRPGPPPPPPPPSSSPRGLFSSSVIKLLSPQSLHLLDISFSLVSAIKSCTHIRVLRHLHAHLFKLGFKSHLYVAAALLHAYFLTVFNDACTLFDEMPHRNIVTWNTMIAGYSRHHHVKAARNIFDQMPLRNLASWSAMIGAYMNHGLWDEGLALFRQMAALNNIYGDCCLKPDQLTLGPILAGCPRMGSVGLLFGKSVHGFAVKNHWRLNVEMGTCLVDMYTKCGSLKDATFIFDTMKDTNVVTWTALICGFAQQGYGKEALAIFMEMMDSNLKPNELTFTGILSACAQAGLVEEGRRCFCMIGEYGLKPRIQHYGCMVHLFGKAGLLGEAYDVINTMRLEPNVVIWGSFLSSCKLHKQFEMADEVINRVMRTVRPENDGGVYSLICDLYVLRSKWDEAEKIRKLMLNQKVRKARGSSFIGSGALIPQCVISSCDM